MGRIIQLHIQVKKHKILQQLQQLQQLSIVTGDRGHDLLKYQAVMNQTASGELVNEFIERFLPQAHGGRKDAMAVLEAYEAAIKEALQPKGM